MEKKLKDQQTKVILHKKYLLGLVNDNRVVLIAALLPAFIWGFKQAREKSLPKMILQGSKFVLMTALMHAKH